MKHSGKSWEELEPYMIEQLSGAVFREVKETEMKEYDEYRSDNARG